jgi:hypothetical protein
MPQKIQRLPSITPLSGAASLSWTIMAKVWAAAGGSLHESGGEIGLGFAQVYCAGIVDPSANDGLLYCVARDEVVGFDFASGDCLGAIARLPRLDGQALEFFRVEPAS